MYRILTALAGALLLAGCLEPNVDSDPPRLVSSTPEDGAINVSVIAPLVFAFNEELNTSTVSTQTVLLRRGPEGIFPGAPTFDATTNEISFGGVPLVYATDYTVTLDGIRDLSGNAMAPVTISFRTVENPMVRVDQLNAGTQGPYSIITLDEYGNAVAVDQFGDAGPDGLFDTADDVETLAGRNELTAPHQVDRMATSNDPGTDTEWGTDDDNYIGVTTYLYDGDGLLDEQYDYVGPGPDGIWSTADDEVVIFRERTYTPEGYVLTEDIYVAGPDGLAWTADDQLNIAPMYEYDARGLRIGSLTSADVGVDGELHTADDPGFVEYVDYDELNNIVGILRYDDFGPDGVFFTADDVLGEIVTITIEPGMQVAEVADGDGVPNAIAYYTLDENNQVVQILQTFDPGPDGDFYTDDDVFGINIGYEYDEDGNRVAQTFYVAGTDGILGTEDDEPFQVTTYDTGAFTGP